MNDMMRIPLISRLNEMFNHSRLQADAVESCIEPTLQEVRDMQKRIAKLEGALKTISEGCDGICCSRALEGLEK